ncbi:hypothetical protein DTO271D3_5195 [Paecilomyces variotii]|nr:hypothetical protein DTO271D3_5195 [Paecilomyces variotii]
MSLLISHYNTVLIILATTGLTTAWNATGRLNTTLTVWDPDVDSYQPTGLELNIGVSYGSSRIPGSSVDTDLQYTVSESIWLSDLEGNSICVAPYTLCALAFTGGLTNTTVIAQMQEDNGNCASVFEPNCIGDLKGALGNAVLEAGNGDLTSHEICASISGAVKIPGSCASIGSLLNRSSSGVLLETSSTCGVNGDQPFTVTSFTEPQSQLGTVFGTYDQYIEGFTPVMLIAFGPNGTNIVAENPVGTRSLSCIRPVNVVKGSRKPGTASPSSQFSIALTIAVSVSSVVFLAL